ncbi:MAG: ATP-binding protein [Streptosporangiaceae bacterium]
MTEYTRAGHFAASLDQVSAARAFVADTLGPTHPCADDAVLLTSEVATNALVHTGSGQTEADQAPSGFTVTVTRAAKGARVEVTDGGSNTIPCACRIRPEATDGRGVAIIDVLAARWGYTREPGRTTLWFDVRP